MIKPLRKRHLQVWTILAFLLPVGIIAAAVVVPKQQYNKPLQATSVQALPVVVRTSENDNYTANLRSDRNNAAWQLEWINKEELTSPTALIYQVAKPNEDIGNALLIGRIEGRGTYYFNLKNSGTNQPFRFVLYDIIHHRQLDSITF
jgi:hypothetical protein